MVQAPQYIHVRILSLLLNMTKVDLNGEKLSDKFIKASVKLAKVLGSKIHQYWAQISARGQ